MMSIKFLGVKFCTESFYNREIYDCAKFEFSSLSSLANAEGDLKPPRPGITRTKHMELTVELCVLTGLTAEFPEVA